MILVLGQNGQVARSLLELAWDEPIVSLGSKDLDYSHPEKIQSTLQAKIQTSPRLIFNAAAYTAVDRAEQERDLAFRINAQSVGEIGQWADRLGIPVIHFSTDYVYAGAGEEAWTEESPTAPVNVYGESKLAGEQSLLAANSLAFIFRISWVYSNFGNNFVKTMLRLGAERNELKVVRDQVGSPMSALAIAQLMHRCFQKDRKTQAQPGVYNLSSGPYTSWYGFAERIFSLARSKGMPLSLDSLLPISSCDFPTPATRPLNSRMSDARFRASFQDELGDWEHHLEALFRRLI